MAQVRIDSTLYVRSHGKAPKGFGAWAFIIMDASCGKEVEIFWIPVATTLTGANSIARRYVEPVFPAGLATGFLSLEVAP